jgi:hypothetical protein
LDLYSYSLVELAVPLPFTQHSNSYLLSMSFISTRFACFSSPLVRITLLLLCGLTISRGVSGQTNGSSLSFKEKGSYVRIPSSTSLSPQKAITIECWIKPNRPGWNNLPQTILSKKSTLRLRTIRIPKIGMYSMQPILTNKMT